MTRIIKRYANRKLYDTQARRYVTLAETEDLVRRGEPVTVIEQSTGADITYSVLSKIVSAAGAPEHPEHEASKKNLLIEMIKAPRRAVLRYVKESVSAGIDRVSQVGEKIEQGLKGILPSGDPNGLEDVVGTYVSTLAAIIDERVKNTLAQGDLPTRAEIARLERRIRDLESRLDASASSHATRRRKSSLKRTGKPKRGPR